jgi:hypothetical protein
MKSNVDTYVIQAFIYILIKHAYNRYEESLIFRDF